MAAWTKGMIIPIETAAGILIFQFNPYEIHDSKAVKWGQLPAAGRKQPYLQYGCGEARHISFSMELSGNESTGAYVVNFCNTLRGLLEPTVMGAGMQRPPKCQVILGGHINATVVIADVKITHGAHRGSSHMTYLADPFFLLPKDAGLRIDMLEWM